jgi:hypothetical protein
VLARFTPAKPCQAVEDLSDAPFQQRHQALELSERRRFLGLVDTRKRKRSMPAPDADHSKMVFDIRGEDSADPASSPQPTPPATSPVPLAAAAAVTASAAAPLTPPCVSSPGAVASTPVAPAPAPAPPQAEPPELSYPRRTFPLDAREIAAIEAAEKRRVEAEAHPSRAYKVVSATVTPTNPPQGHAPLKLVLRVAPT